MSDKMVSIPVVKVPQHTHTLLVGRYDYATHANLSVQVDYYDSNSDTGYQRIVNPIRANEIDEFIRLKNRVMPTALLVNFREKPRIVWSDEDHGYIRAKIGDTVFLYDGQHREAGVTKSWEEGLQNFSLPAVYTNFSELEELTQFNIINSVTKGVDKTLNQACMVRLQKSCSTPEEVIMLRRSLPRNMRANFHNLPIGFAIASMLNRDTRKTTNPWAGKLLKPNEKKKQGVMDEGRFQNYFKSLINNPDDCFPAEIDKKVKLMISYGQALKKLCPNCFDKPRDYLLLRHVGVEFLGKILFPVYKYIGAQGVPSPDQFVGVLKKLNEKMTDEFWKNDTGTARHYHGSFNVALLVREVVKTLNLD